MSAPRDPRDPSIMDLIRGGWLDWLQAFVIVCALLFALAIITDLLG